MSNRAQRTISGQAGLRCTGLSLIEVLIALLMLSIGLVGTASLQLTSMKSAHSSYYRSVASTAALNIEERVWDQARALLTGDGECLSDTITADALAQEIVNTWSAGSTSSMNWSETTADLAGIPDLRVDLSEFTTSSVRRNDVGNDGDWIDAWDQFTAKLTWTENRLNDEQSTERFDYTIRIPCVPRFCRTGSTESECTT